MNSPFAKKEKSYLCLSGFGLSLIYIHQNLLFYHHHH